MGTGSICALIPPKYRYKASAAEFAAALAAARLRAKVTFAPKFDFEAFRQVRLITDQAHVGQIR
jgi:hypothetical protein